jgi:putative transposase
MSHTYATNFIHCVFSTKNRAELIPDDKREQLYAYLFGLCKNTGLELLAVGGTTDHIHLLISLPANKRLSEAVRGMKANSSRWIGETNEGFSWQKGYGAFGVSASQIQAVKDYIRNQAEHHRKRSFEEEFLALLKKSGVDYDPKFAFG